MATVNATKRLRWKKDDPERGLARIGASPRGSRLHDGEKDYACVRAVGGGWKGPVTGWYWCSYRDAIGVHVNTYDNPATDQATAKKQAMDFVKSRLQKNVSINHKQGQQ